MAEQYRMDSFRNRISLLVLNLQSVPGPRVARLERSGRQLDDRKGAQRYRDAPGRYRLTDLEHQAILGDKRHVDRKAHREGVNSLGRGDDDRTAVGQARRFELRFFS